MLHGAHPDRRARPLHGADLWHGVVELPEPPFVVHPVSLPELEDEAEPFLEPRVALGDGIPK